MINVITPVVIKEDTVQYDARAYPVREGDAVDEIVKRLPGMEVDKDGNVKAQGEPVTRIRLNGKDFFGDEASAALQNLPADIVKNIQLIDDYGEEANISGIKSGEPQKIININTKEDKRNGYFARAEAGMGSADRYNGRIRANRFKEDQQVSLDVTNNNTSRRSKGTTENTAAMLNYRDNWGTKVESYGSYRFRKDDNNTLEQKVTESAFEDYTRYEYDNSNNNSRNFDHGLFWNLEYRPDSANYFKLKPRASYQLGSTSSTGSTITELLSARSLRQRNSAASSTSSSFGTELYYNHKFSKKGRNLSISTEINSAHGDNSSDLKNDYTNTDSVGNTTLEKQYQYRNNNNKNTNARLRMAYIEPFNDRSMIEINYQWNRSSTKTVRNTMDLDPVTAEQVLNQNLSNDYNYQFITNRAGLNFRHIDTKLNYFAGVAVMPSVLKGQDLTRDNETLKKTLNWIPSARLVYKFSKKQSFTARYHGRSNQPGFRQLQPITDNSNIQNVLVGNPDLKPEFTNSLGMEYKQTDWTSGFVMNSRVDFNQTNNKIVTTKVIIPDSIKQISSYINTDGFYNARAEYSFAKPFSNRQFTLTYSGGSNFSNNIAFTNNDRITGKNLQLNQGLKFRLDIQDKMNAEINTSFSYNQTRYSSGSLSDRETRTYSMGLAGRTYFHKDLTLGYNFSKDYNTGFNANATNPTLLNLYLDYRFLKGNAANVRFQGYDILNQNTAISRDVFDNVIVDSQSNRLARYFMLTFQYRLQHFGS
ncbi:hypothetical protein ADIARSV_3444 [Arcticibacter svalbardensis MN12-7]|uniref:Outer membrane protein beta-barrel domain-containing protein n=1 Tax=Arcticibacter svalbardensis MN12-7 TaxID=1150600 RepID=R9GP95_9SPHI|nr:hypothetical protein ADIARSV_3444 [Arcticibacter svalbardensis MN12-7]